MGRSFRTYLLHSGLSYQLSSVARELEASRFRGQNDNQKARDEAGTALDGERLDRRKECPGDGGVMRNHHMSLAFAYEFE